MGEIFGVGTAFTVKSVVQQEHLDTTFDYQRPDALRRTLAVQAHLADLLQGADADAHITTASSELEFFQRMTFTLGAARPLSASFVAEVVGNWTWGHGTHALRLLPEAEQDQVKAWADASPDGQWSLDVNVTMADDAPVDAGALLTLPAVTGSALAHTLDLRAALQLRRVELLAPVGVDDLMGTRVRVAHLRGDVEVSATEAVLLQKELRKTLWFRGVGPTDRITATPTWMLASGRVVSGDPLEVTTDVLPLPAPVTWRTIRIISDPQWGELSQVSAILQVKPDGPTASVSFDGPQQSHAIRLDFGDDDERRYRFRTTRVFSGGRVEEDEWAEADVSTLMLGATSPFELVVELMPVGQELPQANVRLIEVKLLYLDPENQVRHEGHALLHSLAERFVWRVPLVDPSRREYEYRVIIHVLTGGEIKRPRQTTSERLIPIAVTTEA